MMKHDNSNDSLTDMFEKLKEQLEKQTKGAHWFTALNLTEQNVITIRYVLKVYLMKTLLNELYIARQNKNVDRNFDEAMEHVTASVDNYHIIDSVFMKADMDMLSHGTDYCTVYISLANLLLLKAKVDQEFPDKDMIEQKSELNDLAKEAYYKMIDDMPNVQKILNEAIKKKIVDLSQSSDSATPASSKTEDGTSYSTILSSMKKGGMLN